MKLTTLLSIAASALSLLVMPTVSGCAPNYKVGDAAGNIRIPPWVRRLFATPRD